MYIQASFVKDGKTLFIYKLDKQAITNIIKRHIKPIEKQKQIKLIIY